MAWRPSVSLDDQASCSSLQWKLVSTLHLEACGRNLQDFYTAVAPGVRLNSLR